MKLRRAALAVFFLLLGERASAVYAPIPDFEQGKALTVYLTAGAYYDTNIFGAATDEISSVVYQFSPDIVFNASLSARTFVSASYRLSLDDVVDRPGRKLLDSHELTARIAHTFTPEMALDVSDTYQIMKNPESLLPGVATVVNTDQSFTHNQFDTRYATSLTKRTGITVKARANRFDYENPSLGRDLNRNEYLIGINGSHALLPELKASTEYRHEAINYDADSGSKNKQSDFGLVGADYVVNARTAASARLGFEYRRRSGDRNQLAPYAELGSKYDYGKGSFVSGGYSVSLEETSNIQLYTDTLVNRFFVNVQQVLTPKIVGTAALNWSPSTLHGRAGVSPNRRETNTQIGLAATYRPGGNWSVTANVDYDNIRSQDPGRNLRRWRPGATAKYAF